MQIRFLLTVIMLSLFNLCSAQKKANSKLALMQGVWANTMNSETEKAFTIIKGNLSLNFVYNTSAGLDFPLTELVKGFYDGNVEDDSLNISALKEDGAQYVAIDKNDIKSGGWVYKPYYLSPKYFDCDGELMSINGGQLVEYGKIDELPFEALTKLYKRGKIDNRNYIKEYLDLDVLSIKATTSIVYTNPNKKSNVQLNRDHTVIVVEEAGKWIKVKYEEEAIGWIKRVDLK